MWIEFRNFSLASLILDKKVKILEEDFLEGKSFGDENNDDPCLIKVQDDYVGILMPAAPTHEIYCYKSSDSSEVIYTDSFFSLVESPIALNECEECSEFFLKKNIFPPGKTLYKEISRLLPGRIYRFDNDFSFFELSSDDSLLKKEISFNDFQSSFDDVIKRKTDGKDIGILLSSGVDSTAVALSAAKYSKSIKTFTMSYQPQISGVASDVMGAKHTSQYLGVNHQIVDVDIASYDLASLGKFVRLMPMSAGLPVGYEHLLRTMSKESIQIALTGQNADLLYNLSATDRPGFNRAGMAALFRRWFMTDSYFKYLDPNHHSSVIERLTHSVIARSGAALYSHFKGRKYSAPENCHELYQSFINSPDVVVFKRDGMIRNDYGKNVSSDNLYEMLVRNKIEQDMMLCDSQMIRRAAEVNNIDICFPFSDGKMVNLWLNKPMNFSDVRYPKRFIREYVERHFPEYSKRDGFKQKDDLSYDAHSWANIVISTDFGRQLQDNSISGPAERVTPYKYLMYLIGVFWLNEIRRTRSLYE